MKQLKKLLPLPKLWQSGKSILTDIFFYLSILFFIIGFNFTDNMAGGWYQQFMPNMNNVPISDIFFLDSLTGWATTGGGMVSDTNFILKTTSSGDDWLIKYRANKSFYRIKFINSNTGFACGGFNSIGQALYKSTNGGENWFLLNSPSVIRIQDMSVLNEDTIWLVNDNAVEGGVFRTTNGGVNWSGQSLPNGNPGKIYMYNRNTGFASSGSGGALYKTINSGVNWTFIPGTEGFLDIKLVDSLTGWKANGSVKKTIDGGLNWVQQVIPSGGVITGSSIGKISVLNKDTIWGTGGSIQYPNMQSRGIIFRTTDGGINWLFQVPDTNIYIPGPYSHIQFLNYRIGWLYTLGFYGGIHTTTGGNDTFYTSINIMTGTVPSGFKLYQNFPNPFNPQTIIKYEIKANSEVKIIVINIQGKEVTTLINKKQSAGIYSIEFSGNNLSSGIYFYSFFVNNKLIDTKRMILLK
jgi:photosystem II stability/assembly factor-like uncharacterized protein